MDPESPPARRRPNPRGQGDLLRDELLQAAVELLEREGDAARVSLRAVGRHAGVSATAAYLQFEDRESLVEAAVDRCFAAFNATLLAADDDRGAPPRARLRALALAYLAFAAEQPTLYAVVFSVRRELRPRRAELPPDAPPRDVDRDTALQRLLDLVAALAPERAPNDARALALGIWAALHGYAGLAPRPMFAHGPRTEPYVEALLHAAFGPA